MIMIRDVPPPLTWHISSRIANYLSHIVTTCVLNQFRGHWLLSDALHATITTNLKLKKKT
jgi:hypothetical protein